MRVIHFADLHIGVEQYGRPLPNTAWSSRMQDFLDAFDEMVEYALAERADAVVFAGDAYKAREPTQTQQREFASRIRRLSDAGIATFLLVGNHDLPNAEGRAHVLEIFRTLDVPNVSIGDNAWFRENGYRPQVLETRAGPLQVAALPWPQVSRLLANDPEVASMSIEQQLKVIQEKLTAVVTEQAQALDPGLPALLTCHVSVNDFLVRENPGSEQWMTVGASPTVLKSALCEESFDYIALGHHHNNMDLKMNTPCWYAGSMQPVDFGEEDQAKGFMVFDIDPKKARGRRVSGSTIPVLRQVKTRRFVTVKVHPKGDDPTAEVCAAIEKAGVADAIVRVEVHASRNQGRMFRVPEARKLLEMAHYVQGVRTVYPEDARLSLPAGQQPDKSSPLETLDMYLRAQQFDDVRRTRLQRAAQDMLAEMGVTNA